MNLAILTPSYIIANVYPNVGSIAGKLGASASLLVVYFLPVCTYLKYKYTAIQNPELATLVQRSTMTKVVSPSNTQPGSMIDDDKKLKETAVLISTLEDEDFAA